MKISEVIPTWRLRPLQSWWRRQRLLERTLERTHQWWNDHKPLWITPTMRRYNVTAAQGHAVSAVCHPDDFIYRFVLGHPGFKEVKHAIDYYFDDGARSARKLGEIIASLNIDAKPVRVLEFASGYGCVTRHLKNNADLSIVASDIHRKAIRFLQDKIGVEARMSAHRPEDFAIEERFDVVFALSFFSHMPRATFGRWIKVLFSRLNNPGYMVFTTHGLESRKHHGNPVIPQDGFWFRPYSEQKDLGTSEYGSTIVTRDFVQREVREQTGQAIFRYEQAFWWEHQDLWIVKNG
jgi:SAM-dependent methyltransferase